MRKINPDDVRSDFDDLLNEVEIFYQNADEVLARDKDKTLLVENTLLTCTVLWEGFLSDLFIAYINRDSTIFADHLARSLEENISGKPKIIYDKYCTLSTPAHLKKADLLELLDAEGNNVTFKNYDDIRRHARNWLAPAHAARIQSIGAVQAATVNAWIAIRNYIAHRSKRSLDAMNAALAAGALHNSGLQRGQNNRHHLGAYLKARPVQNRPPRISMYMTAMRQIAAAI
jgi:hypothetical protein